MTHCQYLDYVPAQPIRDILEHAIQTGWTRDEISRYTGIPTRTIYRVMATTRPAKRWQKAYRSSEPPVLTKYGWCIPALDEITFDLADRIVPRLSCWHTADPELSAIYEAV